MTHAVCRAPSTAVFEREFLIAADREGRSIYQLGLTERRVVRLLASRHHRRPAAVAFQEFGRVVYWTDIAAASIFSLPLTPNISIVRPSRQTILYASGLYVLLSSRHSFRVSK